MNRALLLLTMSIGFLTACRNKQTDEKPLFEKMEATGIRFANNIHNTKDFNIFTYRNFYNGGGVACGDVNNDGLADVFMTANMGSNKLFLNKGSFQFEDVSVQAGIEEKEKWSTGVVMVDINADGWLDIYVCNAGFQKGVGQENALFINQKNGHFVDSAKAYGLADAGYTTHAAFFDYDMDGDLDCYILNNSFIPVNTLGYDNKRNLRAEDWPVADFLKGGGDKLMRNDNGKFVDVSKQANIYSSLIGFGLGVAVGDINGDAWPDLYISNDFFERDYLYINQKNGSFKEAMEQWVGHMSFASMGSDLADINNDGYPEIFATEMLPSDDYRLRTTSTFDNYDVYQQKLRNGFYHQFMQNALQYNTRGNRFQEIAHYAGVEASDWSWGALMFDADNDALTDIYVCNGINHDLTNQDFINFFADDVIQRMAITGQKEEIESIIDKMPQQKIPNNFFHNKGQLKFDDAANQFGFADSSFSNGAAYADLDNDGDLDLVVNNVNQECFVYKNHSQERNGHHFLSVQLKGESKNSFAIGAKIKLFIGRQQLSREVIPSRGFQSSVDYKQVIGIGKDSLVDSLQVIWPDLSTTTIVRPTIDTLLLIDAATAKGQWQNMAMQSDKAYLFETASGFDLHTEDSGYVDFYTERLVPVLLSHEGPKAAVADVDGDGLQDVYIGGAADVAGALYLQKAGKWLKKEAAVFKMYADLEDVAALFFDADKDGDQDLYVGAGGNFVPIFSSREYLHRLYINDGKGNFELQQNGFPVNETNVGAVAANDIDGDGDIDLFIGGRSVPQQYGSSPRSYIMINDGKGHFTDATKTICPALQYPGMVTAAKWVNLLGDAQPELLVVGEWMAPLMLTKKDQQLVEAPHNLADKFGWWQCVETADMDGDGDKDLIIGNIGENFYLKPDSLHPAKLFLNDFDGNGTADKIITRSWNGKDVPVFMKRELEEQMPFLKKQNLTFQNFGFAGVQDLFTQEVMRKTGTKQFNYGASIIAFNNGNGQFSWQKLPAAVQFSSVRAIRSQDMNGDGKMDLLLGGNHFGFLPQFCRLDASNGDLLLNDGKGNLTSSGKGLGWDGELRDLHWLTVNDKQCLLVLQNQRKPILYEWRK